MHRLPVCVLAALSLPAVAQAAAPLAVPVTGFLTDPDGAPVEGDVSMRLRLYTSPGGTSAEFDETQTVTVNGGHFTVYLNAANDEETFLELYRENTLLWLGIAVETNPEMTPRLQLATSPYAAWSEYSSWASDAETVGGIDP